MNIEEIPNQVQNDICFFEPSLIIASLNRVGISEHLGGT